MMKQRIAPIFLILITLGGLFSCREKSNEKLIGQCIHTSEPITILIKKIEPEKSSRDVEILNISYEIIYDDGFQKGEIENGSVEASPEEVKLKAVEIGKTFHASITRLVSGTCNPEPIYPELEDWK